MQVKPVAEIIDAALDGISSFRNSVNDEFASRSLSRIKELNQAVLLVLRFENAADAAAAAAAADTRSAYAE
jgi:hypothetical protein